MKTCIRVLLSFLFLPFLWSCQKQGEEQFSMKTPDGEIVSRVNTAVFFMTEGSIGTHAVLSDGHSLALYFTRGELSYSFFGDTFIGKSSSSTESCTGSVQVKQQTESDLILRFNRLRFTLPSGTFVLNGDLKYARNDAYPVN